MSAIDDIKKWPDGLDLEGTRLSDVQAMGHPITGTFWRIDKPFGRPPRTKVFELTARPCKCCGLDMLRMGTGRGPVICKPCKLFHKRATWAAGKRKARAALRVERSEVSCKHCGASFIPQRSTAQFCSTRCRVAAHRTPAEKAKAWEMKGSGMSAPAIAKDLGRGEQTVRDWFKKERPQSPAVVPTAARVPAPDPAPEPLILEPSNGTQKPKRPQVPDNLKQSHQREQKRIKERWQPIAEHLRAAHDLIRAEKERLCKEYAGAQGSLMMTRRWQQMAEIWAEAGLLSQFAEITGEPEATTLDGLLSELERSSRMANNWLGCIAVYTGCKPDLTRYQPAAASRAISTHTASVDT